MCEDLSPPSGSPLSLKDPWYLRSRSRVPRLSTTLCLGSSKIAGTAAQKVDTLLGMPRAGQRTPPAQRFWPKVDVRGPDECWIWTAAKNPVSGYGQFTVDPTPVYESGGPRSETAHRTSFWLTHGRWPEPMCLHSCDNKLCVNPAHLREGDHRENWEDFKATGRKMKMPLRKLTDEDIKTIHRLKSEGLLTQRAIAARFGVHESLISRIVRRG